LTIPARTIKIKAIILTFECVKKVEFNIVFNSYEREK